MRKLIILALAVMLLLAIAAPAAIADSDNWDWEKQYQVGLNRCANAGAGNGGEFYLYTPWFDKCLDKHRLLEYWYIWHGWKFNDSDPGNSADNNNAPAAPPGQVD